VCSTPVTALDPAVRAGEAAAAAAVAAERSGGSRFPADGPDRGRVLRRRQHDDGRRVDLHFARGLAARKFFTTSDMLGFVWQQLKFRIGGRELSYGHTTGRDTALSFVAGRPVATSSSSARRSTTS
jgi:hypothetical protein